MKLKVLFFSVLRDIAGGEELTVDLAADRPWTAGQLLEQLYAQFPKLRAWDQSLLIAADLDYVTRDATLQNGQEIAIMPPVQGG